MKRIMLTCVYGIFVLLALWGIGAAVYLYPTHAANGTSAAYFTMVLFPTAFLLAGLTAVFWRYWWCLLVGGTAVLAGYLFAAEPGNLVWLWFLVGYLVCGGLAGLTGRGLCRRKKHLQSRRECGILKLQIPERGRRYDG